MADARDYYSTMKIYDKSRSTRLLITYHILPFHYYFLNERSEKIIDISNLNFAKQNRMTI